MFQMCLRAVETIDDEYTPLVPDVPLVPLLVPELVPDVPDVPTRVTESMMNTHRLFQMCR